MPEGREALMQTYQQLFAAGRIEFVTFHQSMSYEDFVEGRQPMTGSEEDDDTSSAGFRLETVPGIFRRIAKRAETSWGRSPGGDAITVADRQVFKMSIGEANNPEDAHLFEEAIEGGYALLGFEDIDWSDDKYANREAIIEACKTKGHTDVNVWSGAVQMPFIFRNLVRTGDIVIVSKGNSLYGLSLCFRSHQMLIGLLRCRHGFRTVPGDVRELLDLRKLVSSAVRQAGGPVFGSD